MLMAHLHHQGAAEIITVSTGMQARSRASMESGRDLVVIDGGLPDGPVLPLLADLRRLGWRRVVLLTPRSDVFAVQAALNGGVRGYVVSRPDEPIGDIGLRGSRGTFPAARSATQDSAYGPSRGAREDGRGERIGLNGLSRREIEVLSHVSRGMSNKDIGEELGLSALTVKSHLARIARKLGTGDRAHMVALLMRARLIA
jgi:DNA-binding NarL/FixJ family response regulator